MGASASLHFRILEDIARDLSGDANFPTCLDAAILIRDSLCDPFASLDRVGHAVGMEPLISSRLLRLANSAAYRPGSDTITDVGEAISRLGFEVVRTTSLAVAMDQMLKATALGDKAPIAQRIWAHSIEVAAIARVLAKRLGRISPDAALLAGLVHDMGAFYLLYRSADYPAYADTAALIDLLLQWHESIGESLLHALKLPEAIQDAVSSHDRIRDLEAACSLRDALYFANQLSGGDKTWANPESPTASRDEKRPPYADLVDEAQDDIASIKLALAP